MQDRANSPQRRAARLPSQNLPVSATLIFVLCLGSRIASAAIIGTSGTVVQEFNPYPAPSDSEILAFDEVQSVAFVATQPLDFGSIAPGTLVNSHYIQYDTASPTGSVGPGSVTFDGAILGVITTTSHLSADLNPDVAGTSDTYFGLEATLGPYPMGAPGTEQFRGLGSPMDSLTVSLGSSTLVINGLDIETVGALDGIRVLTAIPEPDTAHLVVLGLMGLAARRRVASVGGRRGGVHVVAACCPGRCS